MSVLTHEKERYDGVKGDDRADHWKYSGEGLGYRAAAACLRTYTDQHSQGRPSPPEVPYRPCRSFVVHFKVLYTVFGFVAVILVVIVAVVVVVGRDSSLVVVIVVVMVV